MKSGEGTLIAFATGPGQTALDGEAGTNSPFTRALLANIAAPGVEIQQAMTKVRAQVNEETNKNQLPWGHTNLIGSVYLNPVAGAASADGRGAEYAGRRRRARSSEVELEFWRSIKDSNKPEELNAYLTNYPNGTFKSLALARIASLQDGPSTATRNLTAGIDPATFTQEADQTAEDQIGLDKGQRRDVQRRLTGLGFDTRVTGKFDEPTRAVITRWQAARGYPRTGFLNALQLKALQSEIVATRVASTDDGDDDTVRHSRHHGGGGGGPSLSRRRTGRVLRRHDGRIVRSQVGFTFERDLWNFSNKAVLAGRLFLRAGFARRSRSQSRRASAGVRTTNRPDACLRTIAYKTKKNKRQRSNRALFQSPKRQNEYQGYRAVITDRPGKLDSDPDRRGHHRGGDFAVDAGHGRRHRFVGMEGPTDENMWLIDRLTGNVYKCQAADRGKASCEPDTATGSIGGQPKR